MKPEDLRRGDRCVTDDGKTAYEVLAVLDRNALSIRVKVQHQPDMGIDVRELVIGTDVPNLVRGPKGTLPGPNGGIYRGEVLNTV
jgi:hypothetical protein